MRLPLLDIPAPAATPAHFDTGPRSIGAVRVLRISVTDRCNFRCVYCMPADGVRWLPQNEILSFEEIATIVRAAVDVHGIRRFKLTGGEPTVRHGLVDLVAMLRAIGGVDDLSLTTNGFALESLADPLKQAGLDRVTVSVDSLRADRFKQITRTGDLATVMRGIDRAIDAFGSVKINCVTMRGTNDDEMADFASLARTRPASVRFIEYMPLGDSQLLAEGNPFEATTDDAGRVSYHTGGPSLLGLGNVPKQGEAAGGQRVASEEIGPAGGCGAQSRGADAFLSESVVRDAIERVHGPLVPIAREAESGVGPSVPYGFADHPDAPGRVGFISAMSAPFCATCNRLRLTATGVLRSCLFEGGEVDLKPILRGEASSRAIAQAMTDCVRLKPDVHSVRGNEQMSRLGG